MPVDGRYVAVVHVKTLAYILGQESITCVSKTEAAMTVCSLYNISLSEMYPSYDATQVQLSEVVGTAVRSYGALITVRPFVSIMSETLFQLKGYRHADCIWFSMKQVSLTHLNMHVQ